MARAFPRSQRLSFKKRGDRLSNVVSMRTCFCPYTTCNRHRRRSLQWCRISSSSEELCETKFEEDATRLREPANTQSLAELFTGFYHFQDLEFNWCLHALCVCVCLNGTSGEVADKKKLMTSTRAVVRRGSFRSQAQLGKKMHTSWTTTHMETDG